MAELDIQEEDWIDRDFDADFGRRVLSRRSWMIARILGLFGAGVAVLLFGEHRPLLLAGMIAALAVVQFLIWRHRDNPHNATYLGYVDVLTAFTILLVIPPTWPAIAAWMGGLVAWQALLTTTRLALPFSLTVLAALGIAAFVNRPTQWWTVVVTIGLLAGSYLWLGRLVRRGFAETELELLKAVTQTGGVVLFQRDHGVIYQIHGDVIGLTGLTKEQMVGRSFRDFIHPDDVEAFWIEDDDLYPGRKVGGVTRFVRPDGRLMYIRGVGSVSFGPTGELNVVAYITDVTALELSTIELETQLRRDALTGLPNRRALHEFLDERLERGEPLALVLADLDRFKEVNDSLGHDAGDNVLCQIANRLSSSFGLRNQDGQPHSVHVSRLGGDEFALVSTDLDGLDAALDQMIAACTDPLTTNGVPVALGVSLGVVHTGPDSSRESLIRQADIAMYEAKRRGLQTYEFDVSLERSSLRRLSLAADLRPALERKEIVLYAQPQVDLTTGEIVGVEALARWDHPELGVLEPAEFLEVALVSEHWQLFEEAVLEQSILLAARLSALNLSVRVAANLTVQSLRQPEFPKIVFNLLARHGVDPARFAIELSEQDVDVNSPTMVDNLTALYNRGVGIAVDDFGTGYSSLRRVIMLDVSEIKIDRTFVEVIDTSRTVREVISGISRLTNSLGLGLVVEGIETEAQADILRSIGCSIGQGFLFAPPLPIEEFLAFVHNGGGASAVASS